ncbi:MAG TPA: NUDIX hydrolase [Nocardioidaceae bacterium]|nr:NUDIX hydrolase [Nocardioidaceae bacterium]
MLPDTLLSRATRYLAGEIQAALPRDASTVLLLRDTAAGLEVYVLRRQLSMAFAGGMYAFPGGSVDPRDSDRHISWAGPQDEEWARRLGCDAALARALVCAAVRELFEEAGVLLAGSGPEDVVGDTTADAWERDRAALADHSLAFAELLARRGMMLRSDLLGYWAHWTTPEFEPRRYDTRFFVAALPVGQRTRDVSGEADHVAWEFPGAVATAADERRAAMLPPTYVALADLTRYADVAAVLSEAAAPGRTVAHVVPGVEVVDGGAYLTLPDGVLP